jgi:hypothetical protein
VIPSTFELPWFSRRLWPPVVADVGAYDLVLLAQSDAALHERLLQLLDLLEVAVRNPYPCSRATAFL